MLIPLETEPNLCYNKGRKRTPKRLGVRRKSGLPDGIFWVFSLTNPLKTL